MSRYLSYIHNLRGAAIFFVVGVHARGNINDWASNTEQHSVIATFFDSREGNGTIMFIFIAGFLFHYLGQKTKFEFKRYLEQKFKYVILPYLLISIPIIIHRINQNFTSSVITDAFNDQPLAYQFLYYLATGAHMAPFWFISAIIIFYLTSPLLHALGRPFVFKYIFPVLFITCFFTYRPDHNANPLLSYLHYLPIYFMGMWASYYRERILGAGNWLLIPLVIMYLALAIAEITGWLPVEEKLTFEQVVSEGLLVFNVFMLKAVLLCFITMMVLYLLRDRKMPFLEVLGEYSFGIFFVHFIVILVSRRILLAVLGPFEFSILTFAIYFAFVLLASTATVYFIKKLTGTYSRNLIGS